MGKGKLERFEEMKLFPNVFQFTKELKGQWREKAFQNDRPLVLELACGGGEYANALGRLFPGQNFIGLDIKGARIYKGAKMALLEQLYNVAFLRTHIDQITDYFAPGEVSEIWITFPDPFLQNGKWKKRLTSSLFLNRYRQILQPGAFIHLKTDSQELYDFTLLTIAEMKLTLHQQTDDVYRDLPGHEVLGIKTFYEQMHLKNGKSIKYLKFSLPV